MPLAPDRVALPASASKITLDPSTSDPPSMPNVKSSLKHCLPRAIMADLDSSPRAAKRQRTTASSSCRNGSLVSRILKPVKQAVYGKKPKAKKANAFGPDITPRKNIIKSTSQKRTPAQEDASPLDDESDELGNEDDGVMTATPTKPRLEIRQGIAGRSMIDSSSGNNGNGAQGSEDSPSKKKRKKYKGWAYLDEGEDVGINNQDQFARIAEEAAREAAKAEAENKEAATIKAKNLRERKVAASVNETAEPTKAIRVKRKRDKAVGLRGEDIPIRDVYDELPEDELGQVEATEVRLKTPKKIQSTPRKKMKELSTTKSREAQGRDIRPNPSDGFDASFPMPKTISPHKESAKPSSKNQPTDSPFTTAPHAELPTALSKLTSTKELFAAASRLESLLQKHPSTLAKVKHQIIGQITSKRRLPILPHVSEEYQKVHQLLSQTVLAGEGNSMLVIGSRGSGKTAMVETAIANLSESNKDDFHVVRLNGFIHTDDKLALREIWRQLGKELEGDDEAKGLRSNYADTLTSLLALLSHQDESQEENGEQASTAKSVIFVLDEFDLFAQHPRQTLLYNLFDVAQSHRNAPIAVLGLTTKVNVVDSLEKRVKSRFGQRYVHLSLPKSFQSFKDICLEALIYHAPSSSSDATFAARLHQHQSEVEIPPELSGSWNTYTTALLSSAHFLSHLHFTHSTTNRPVDFLSATVLPFILALTPSNLSNPPTIHTLSPPDSSLALLPTLPILALSLLIAAARLDIVLLTDICTFDMAYEEYVALASRTKLQSSASGQLATGSAARVWSMDAARGAWERLVKVGLLIPACGAGGGRGGGGELWRCDIGLEEIGGWLEGEGRGSGGTAGLGKWCREI